MGGATSLPSAPAPVTTGDTSTDCPSRTHRVQKLGIILIILEVAHCRFPCQPLSGWDLRKS